MKTLTVKYEKMSMDDAFEKMQEAVRTGIPYDRSNELLCPSIESVLNSFSRSKLEVFYGIVQHKPSSLTELAKILDKDLGNVSRDANALALSRIIELQKDKNDPRILRPIALFDRIVFDFTPTPRKAKGA